MTPATSWIENARRPGTTVRILFGAMVWNQPDFAQPQTEFTECTGSDAGWFEGMRAPAGIEGFALFGMPIQLYNGVAYADATAAFTETSRSATSWTEVSG